MKHPEREKIVPYLSKQLNKNEAKQFEEHLKKCPTCSAELRILGAAKKTLAQEEKELPKIDVVSRVLGKIAGSSRSLSPKPVWDMAAPRAKPTPRKKRKGKNK